MNKKSYQSSHAINGKTHLDLRNDKCIKIHTSESMEYSSGLFNIFIEIKLINLFIQLVIHSVPSVHQLPFPLKQNVCQCEKNSSKKHSLKTPSQLGLGALTFAVTGI